MHSVGVVVKEYYRANVSVVVRRKFDHSMLMHDSANTVIRVILAEPALRNSSTTYSAVLDRVPQDSYVVVFINDVEVVMRCASWELRNH